MTQPSAQVLHLTKAKRLERLRAKQGGGEGEPPQVPDTPSDLGGIKPLGYHRDHYYYLSPATGEVVELKADQHKIPTLFRLAPRAWWKGRFPGEDGRIAVQWAQATLMEACHACGPYDPGRIRGVGVWWEGRAVVHLGDKLLVDGKVLEPRAAELAYIYEASASLGELVGRPFRGDEALRLLDACEGLNWRRRVSARLFAGFLVMAPICGALRWRSHAWLTGESGSGKTFALDYLVAPLLGRLARHVQGETTEAGVRQLLGPDARPVIFDEAEGEDERGQRRMQQVLSYFRQLSADTAGKIAKGSTSHQPRLFEGRAMCLMASVGVPLTRQADESRFTVLSLQAPPRDTAAQRRQADEQFGVLRGMAERIDSRFAADMLATSLAHLKVLRDNHEEIADQVARQLGDRRLGDQLGGLLTGARFLQGADRLSRDEAADWVASQDWQEDHPGLVRGETDHERCFANILSGQVRVEVPGGSSQPAKALTRSLGELAEIVLSLKPDEQVDVSLADKVMKRHGLLVQQHNGERALVVANTHPMIAQLLHATPFDRQWRLFLERLEGAEKTSNSLRFGPGPKMRGVIVPKHHVLGRSTETEVEQ